MSDPMLDTTQPRVLRVGHPDGAADPAAYQLVAGFYEARQGQLLQELHGAALPVERTHELGAYRFVIGLLVSCTVEQVLAAIDSEIVVLNNRLKRNDLRLHWSNSRARLTGLSGCRKMLVEYQGHQKPK